MLGFDAIGRLALGQLPQLQANVLVATVGSFSEAGQAALFKISDPVSPGAFSETGNGAAFRALFGSAQGAFSVTGQAITLSNRLSSSSGSYSAQRNASLFDFKFPCAGTSYLINGFSVNELILEAAGAAPPYVLTGNAVSFSRDFINWLKSPNPLGDWNPDGVPASTWTAANSQASSWNNQVVPTPEWASSQPPSGVWTVDPDQQILPPVTG